MSSTPTTIRFIGPKGNAATLTFNGRAYSVAAAATIDVPAMDTSVCAANGWVQIGNGSGTTAPRREIDSPPQSKPGAIFRTNCKPSAHRWPDCPPSHQSRARSSRRSPAQRCVSLSGPNGLFDPLPSASHDHIARASRVALRFARRRFNSSLLGDIAERKG